MLPDHTNIPLDLPEEDRRWLSFVDHYDRILDDLPEFAPLRRYIYGSIYSPTFPPKVPRWRNMLRVGRQIATTTTNCLSLREADVLIFQDIDRSYFTSMIVRLQTVLRDAGLSSMLVAKAGLLQGIPEAYPELISEMPEIAETFANRVTNLYKTPNLSVILDRNLRQYYGYRRAFERILKHMKPKVIVLPNDQFLPSATLAQVARFENITSFVMQHGAANPYQYPLQADKFLAWGEVDKRYYTNLGMPPENIIVVGSLRHDEFVRTTNNRLIRKHILLISNGNNEDRNGDLPRLAYEWLRKFDEDKQGQYEIYVRYHPREMDKYRMMGQVFNQVPNTVPITNSIRQADVVVGYVSTALLESVLIGRPTIQIVSRNTENLCDFWTHDVAIRADSIDILKDAIISLMRNDQAYYSALDEQHQNIGKFFNNYPNAHLSMIDKICSIIEEC